MAKKVDPVISLTGNFESAATALAAATKQRGGSLTEALVYLAQPKHEADVGRIADILADVCKSTAGTSLAPIDPPNPLTLVLIKKVEMATLPEKNTADCFSNNKRYCYRDGNIDNLLPKQQQAQAAGHISVYQFQKQMIFAEMAAVVLKVAVNTPIATMSKLLKERGHTIKLTAPEALIERQESGEDVGLRTNGYGNFAFVENEDGSVSVLHVYRGDTRWDADVCRLDYGVVWSAESRLLLPNSDTVVF